MRIKILQILLFLIFVASLYYVFVLEKFGYTIGYIIGIVFVALFLWLFSKLNKKVKQKSGLITKKKTRDNANKVDKLIVPKTFIIFSLMLLLSIVFIPFIDKNHLNFIVMGSFFTCAGLWFLLIRNKLPLPSSYIAIDMLFSDDVDRCFINSSPKINIPLGIIFFVIGFCWFYIAFF